VAFRATEVAVPVGHCVFFCVSRGSGSLAFPAPSSTLAVAGRALEVFPGSRLRQVSRAARVQCVRPGDVGPRGLSPLLQSALVSAGTPRNLRRGLEFLLSWDSPAFFPSAVRPSACPLPEAEASFGPTVPTADSRSVLVVSHHLDGFLHAGAAGLLHPAASSGVRRVSRPGFQITRECPASPSRSPRRGSYPSKSSPHQQPYRITAAVALVPLLHAILARTCSTGAEHGAIPRAEAPGSVPERCRGPRPLSAPHNPSGRGRRGCGATRRAEAVEAASPALAEACVGACSRWPKPAWARCVVGDRGRLRRGSPDFRRGPTRGPDCPATEAAVRPPRGPTHLADRGRRGVCRSPRWATESESRCAALVMLRSAEADPHVTNRALRAGRQADLLRLRRASSRDPKVLVRRVAGTTLQSVARSGEPRRPRPSNPENPTTAPKHVTPSRAPVARRLRQRRSDGTADFRALLR